MNIIGALEVSHLFYPEDRVSPNPGGIPLTLVQIEEKYVEHGLEDGCSGMFKVVYSDDTEDIFFNYPEDMTQMEAILLSEKVAADFYPE